MSCNSVDRRHVLMWDYDHQLTESKISKLSDVAESFRLSLIILKTVQGVHIVDPHLFTITELDSIQTAIRRILPSDYPKVSEIYAEDVREGVNFMGTTLRISKPYPEMIMAIYFGDGRRDLSKGHLLVYSFLAGHQLRMSGKQINTNVTLVGYGDDKHGIQRQKI